MNKVRALVAMQWKAMLRQPAVIAFFLALPLACLFLVLFALQPLFSSQPHIDPFAVAVVDLDQSLETRMIIGQLTASDDFRGAVEFLPTDMERGQALLENDEVAAMVIIPKRFASNMRAGRNMPIEVVGNPQRPLQYRIFLALMHSAADLISAAQSGVNTVHHFLKGEVDSRTLNAEVNKAILDFSLRSLGRRRFFHDTLLTETGSFTLKEYYAAAGSVVLSLLMGLYLLTVVRQEFSVGTEKRLYAHGLSPAIKVIAKFCALFAVLLFQLLLALAMFLLLAGGRVTGNWFPLLAVILLMAADAGMLFTFLSSLRLHPYLELLVGTLAVVALAVLGGNVLPLAYFPPWVSAVATWTVTYWMRHGFLHTAFIWDRGAVQSSLGAMLAASVLLFCAACLAEKLRRRRP